MNWISRQLRWFVSGRNPVARGWDRLEAALVVLAVLVALVAVPFALAFGSQAYAQRSADADAQAASRVRSTAVLITDAPVGPGVQPAAATEEATGVWRLPDGSERTGQVDVEAGTAAGTKVPIWLDQAGNPVAQPLTRQDALGAAIGVAVLGWLGFAGVLALLVWLGRFALDRRRDRGWTQEWAELSRDLRRF